MPAQWFARQTQQPVRHLGLRMRLLAVGPLDGRRFFAVVKDRRQRNHRIALDVYVADTWVTVSVDCSQAADPFPPGFLDSIYVGEEFAVGAARSTRALHLGEIEVLELDDAAAP
jgi:hypothetical protein